ncbi:GNAT family N-acetyltransferase [Radiobacillus sp. PE A8.2]|uniref:GNAT family N-acetyltransferase n=1 Tax=Radiobacillus sp. PE A8.2 TaxID=3380349 RepID=UPI00388D9D11
MRIVQLGEGDEIPYELLFSADPSKAMINRYLEKGTCFMAVEATKVIGTFILLKSSENTAEIMNIAVSADFQNQGIGKRLIEHAKLQAKQWGCRHIEIGTGNSSIGQLALYQKCGFRITGVDHDFFIRNYDEPIIENGIACRDMIR